ncbi:MAG: UvrD-helicase domain-containing protein [Chloroflexi bacterium]|nr:UvrD-helicase domain-containing protein [Chloroflexota bacterium]
MDDKTAIGSQISFTPEQHDAVHIHDKNLIVVAGAGSGKTRVLVERYLQLLEANPEWPIKSLVAITFTREAAFEMRHRVRLELERRATPADEDVWLRHLSELDSARIDTIHGLCASILRANAAQAGIDPKFDVLDEIEASILLENAVEETLASLDPELLALFSFYDSDKILGSITRQDLVSLSLPSEAPNPGALLKTWRERWSGEVLRARQQLCQSEDVQTILSAAGYPSDDRLGMLYEQYQAYLTSIAAEDDAEGIWQLIAECHSRGAVGNIGSAASWGGAEAKKEAASLLRRARDRLKGLLDEVGEPLGELDAQSAQLLPLWIRLLGEIQGAYRKLKAERALVDFDDLERLTAQVLSQDHIRRRYREAEFNHLLVDEFQDTNDRQWQIIRALADLDRGATLFTVGDPKQGIYGFRGADVSVFNRVRDQIAKDANGKELALSTSFRGHRRLIEQFNGIFKGILVRADDSPTADFQVPFDRPMTAFREKSPGDPPIECILLDYQARGENGPHPAPKPRRARRIPADEMRHWEAFEISGRVKRLIDSQRLVFDRHRGGCRPIMYGDIAVLFQAMSKVKIYEDCFKTRGIPFLTIAGRGYYDRQEVWDMLDLLRCLHNPLDNLSLATALRSPLFGFSDDLLFALRLMKDPDPLSSNPVPLWTAMRIAQISEVPGIADEDQHLLKFALDTLDELRQIAGRVTIFELLGQALTSTGYLSILTGLPDGARRRGNVEKLLKLAEDSGKITLGKFSRYLEDLSAREIREGEVLVEAGNAIRLMTVHASKGLEFPMVILADASWTRGSGAAPILLNDPDYGLSCQVFDVEQNKTVAAFAHRRNARLLAQKEAAERKRLLYVAATRAQDYLLVSGQMTFSKSGQLSARGWLGQLLAAFDMHDLERKEEGWHSFNGDRIRVLIPPLPPSHRDLQAGFEAGIRTSDTLETSGELPSLPPPLIKAIPPHSGLRLKHISATQLADLGEYRHSSGQIREFYRRRLHSPAGNEKSIAAPNAGALGRRKNSRRVLGAIVHDLLRFGHYQATDDLIRSCAWREGLTLSHDIDETVDAVKRLLADFRQSNVFGWLSSARAGHRPVYTELPFVYRTSGRIIHGVMDLLLQGADGTWAIVDYKTTSIQGTRQTHVRRYTLQLAVYAAAAQARLGLPDLPATYVHHLTDNSTLLIDKHDCLAELNALEARIVELEQFHA